MAQGLNRALVLVDAVVAGLAHEPCPRAQCEGVERTAPFVAAVLSLGDERVDVAGVGALTRREQFASVALDVEAEGVVDEVGRVDLAIALDVDADALADHLAQIPVGAGTAARCGAGLADVAVHAGKAAGWVAVFIAYP